MRGTVRAGGVESRPEAKEKEEEVEEGKVLEGGKAR